jgi:hypothetical protein
MNKVCFFTGFLMILCFVLKASSFGPMKFDDKTINAHSFTKENMNHAICDVAFDCLVLNL